MADAIVLDKITKTFGDVVAVRDLDLVVPQGALYGLIGPNGAGKTTMIRMMLSILFPDRGSLRVLGRASALEAKDRIGYLPEERGLYKKMRVGDFLVYMAHLKGLEGPDVETRVRRWLQKVDLAEFERKRCEELSKGMQQKVQFCTVLIGEPRLLILDEPFTGLDPINTQLFEEVLAERRAAGATVLLSTHQMNKVEELCDRALMINRGHMVLYGSVRDFRRQYADHAVLLRCEGRPEPVPGVRGIEPADGGWKVLLEPAATPQAVLGALLERGTVIESFSTASLPLEDVFVKVVRDGLGLDHGRSEPTGPDFAPVAPAQGGGR
jgi:ABC-2 type transport system ATP-binding protein